MQVPQGTDNLRVYNDPKVASHYAGLDYLTSAECFLFDSYIKLGSAILDIGVGGGRTTPRLSEGASRYVGVDYAEAMVRWCRDKFPQLEFRVCDAADLSMLADGEFDAIVMAFNGMDYVLPEERRWQCLRECRRLLKRGGVLIFSSHNPRSILVRPAWEQERVREFAKKFAGSGALYWLAVVVITVTKAMQAVARAAAGSLVRIVNRITKPTFWSGEGLLHDSSHGGLTTHCWVPNRVIAELTKFDFRLAKKIGDDYPSRSFVLVTDWYYYVFQKEGTGGG